ncbi:F-box protein [Capsicum baccatum]|uniref:F-box protein n=1 Tax=Capsicum baccatum TaxID=33114 RepID=A0A2G2VVF8_CAPBA|nr:F-box protein [Capsicum baccatum]PHT36941.1 F-box protein [Capsicum baccatum]
MLALLFPEQVTVNLHEKFKNAIEAYLPGTIDELTLKAEKKKAQQNKPSFWDSIADSKASAFRFSFLMKGQ